MLFSGYEVLYYKTITEQTGAEGRGAKKSGGRPKGPKVKRGYGKKALKAKRGNFGVNDQRRRRRRVILISRAAPPIGRQLKTKILSGYMYNLLTLKAIF